MNGLEAVIKVVEYEKAIAQLKAENAYLRERHAEAVAQLPATIEVLEMAREHGAEFDSGHFGFWWGHFGEPHLNHLKALAKEAEV